MKEIFLSYRRSDAPGYVGRLADSLNGLFGEHTVYRDVDCERAGGNWKKSITRSVSGAQIVLAMIGPQWQGLLAARTSTEQDWIRFELNQARNLDIPIIPVRLTNTQFDQHFDLGDLAWLTDLSFFELADSQGRWQKDIVRLAEEIVHMTTLEISGNWPGSPGSSSQLSLGKQSPNIVSGGGDVTISFGKDSGNS